MDFKPYRYVKGLPGDKKAKKPPFDELFPLGLVFLGSLILSTQIVLPFFSFSTQAPLAQPVGGDFGKERSVLGRARVQTEVFGVPRTIEQEENVPPMFFLSIPQLGIEGARVKKDTLEADPQEFLGHFLGSALPGQEGVVFIYGHSTFPLLFDPEDYLTIFSTIHSLEEGDRLIISYPGRRWEYEVEGSEILKPEEVAVADYVVGGASRLVLMTCFPPGTRSRRLLVSARLVTPQEVW